MLILVLVLGVGLGPVEAGAGRWWLVDGVVWVERRGGGRAGGGFEAERRGWPGGTR
jgi:hypothetical protein